MSTRKKVVVAMSGGVDSAVAAALLKQQGYDCIGVFMRLGGGPEDIADAEVDLAVCSLDRGVDQSQKTRSSKQGCCSSSDAADARYVAGLLDIPFYALNFQHDFGGIIDYFVREYNAGRTPNPCVRCNEYLKFGKLARYARAVGADYVATGHYARVVQHDGKPQLMRGLDHTKDQSYVLFGVPAEELTRMLLPIGDRQKTEVRQIAQELGLPVFSKPDSQEICFVPDQDYARLVRAKSPESVRPGPLLSSEGASLGTHTGHQQFTVGQRKGLGIALGYPVYVTAIDAPTNTVTLGKKEHLLRRGLVAREVNWIAPPPPTEHPIRCTAKIRYNSPPTAATAMLTGPDELTVRFDEPVLAITPGQAVVCYEGERLLGGGWIDSVAA